MYVYIYIYIYGAAVYVLEGVALVPATRSASAPAPVTAPVSMCVYYTLCLFLELRGEKSEESAQSAVCCVRAFAHALLRSAQREAEEAQGHELLTRGDSNSTATYYYATYALLT